PMASGIWGMSPAGDWILFHMNPLDANGMADIALVPFGTNEAPRILSMNLSGAFPYGFTPDSAYVAWSGPSPASGARPSWFAPTANAGTAVPLASAGTQLVISAATGPYVVFDDAFDGMHVNLQKLNLSKPPISTIATGANVGFAVTPVGDKVIYAT